MNLQERINKGIDKKWKNRMDARCYEALQKVDPSDRSLRQSTLSSYDYDILNSTNLRQYILTNCPMLSSQEVSRIENFSELRCSHAILVIEDHEDILVPAFQFQEVGKLFNSAKKVNQFFDANDNDWQVASWWYSPIDYTQHVTPSDFVDDYDRVIYAMQTTVRVTVKY